MRDRYLLAASKETNLGQLAADKVHFQTYLNATKTVLDLFRSQSIPEIDVTLLNSTG